MDKDNVLTIVSFALSITALIFTIVVYVVVNTPYVAPEYEVIGPVGSRTLIMNSDSFAYIKGESPDGHYMDILEHSFGNVYDARHLPGQNGLQFTDVNWSLCSTKGSSWETDYKYIVFVWGGSLSG